MVKHQGTATSGTSHDLLVKPQQFWMCPVVKIRDNQAPLGMPCWRLLRALFDISMVSMKIAESGGTFNNFRDKYDVELIID